MVVLLTELLMRHNVETSFIYLSNLFNLLLCVWCFGRKVDTQNCLNVSLTRKILGSLRVLSLQSFGPLVCKVSPYFPRRGIYVR